MVLDGIIITERKKHERVIYTRQNPGSLASTLLSFQQRLQNESATVENIDNDLFNLPQQRVTSTGNSSAASNSITAQLASSLSSDYLNLNVPWAENIIHYMKQVNKGCLPIFDGQYLVSSFMNQRLIVFTVVGPICFYVIGDETHGEMFLKDICRRVVEGARAACKRNPDDVEILLKNYARLTIVLDRVLMDEVESETGDSGGLRFIADMTD